MSRLALPELMRRVDSIRQSLIHETDYAPGWVLAYGRPHEYARARSFPKFTAAGAPVPGAVRFAPDCPRPVRGRCECAPDGSWRPVGGSLKADALAHNAVFVETSQVPDEHGRRPGVWTDALYVQAPDGLWRCTRPYRRAMERLRGRNLRDFLVLDRLLDGYRIDRAWYGLGEPKNMEQAALGICVYVENLAAEEARSEYERRPRSWRSTTWIEKSDAQQAAELDEAVA